jgi:hypothetical protein
MNKSDLIKSAEKLQLPSQAASNEFEEKRELLAAEMNRLMTSRDDLVQLVGEGNIPMMKDNHRNHARFMAAVFLDSEPEVLVETVLWVFRAYRSHGFKLTYWPAQLDNWVELFKTHLSAETFNEIYPFYNWMIVNQAVFVLESDKLNFTLVTPADGN